MQVILDAINELIKEILIGAINGNLSTMFGDVNEKVGTIAAEVGRTPQAWNANVFSMIRALSENVIVPIAGLVITYVLCYELISMVTEKNNMHDIDTFMFFKWVFKAFVAVYLVTHTFDITMAVFDMAQHVVSGASGVMIAVMLPCFLFAMYEKHGQPLEVVAKHIIQTKFIAPKERPYQTQNLYAVLERQRKLEKEVSAIAKGTYKKGSGKKKRRG